LKEERKTILLGLARELRRTIRILKMVRVTRAI